MTMESLTPLIQSLRKSWVSEKDFISYGSFHIRIVPYKVCFSTLGHFPDVDTFPSKMFNFILFFMNKGRICLGELISELALSGAREVPPCKEAFEELIWKEKASNGVISKYFFIFSWAASFFHFNSVLHQYFSTSVHQYWILSFF